MEKPFTPDSYRACCSLCGRAQTFERRAYAIRETYRCAGCRASLREREQAAALLACYATPAVVSIAQLVEQPSFRNLRIYEPGTSGPFRALMRSLPFHQQSDYLPPERRANPDPKLLHQDLQSMDFPDQAFNLVLSSDILEHVRHPRRALAEIARVLKPGGRHIFTVPLQHPMAAASVARVDVSTAEDRHLLAPHYHGDGKGGRSLVYTDFGADIADFAAAAGFTTQFHRPATTSQTANMVVTLVCMRRPLPARHDNTQGSATAQPQGRTDDKGSAAISQNLA